MQVTYASDGVAGRPNEDYALCGNNFAVILDGATAPAHIDSGCIHSVSWLVHRLAAALAPKLLEEPTLPLTDLLAASIEQVCKMHGSSCDLSNPDSPSTTVSIVRISEQQIDYLSIGDSPIVFWHPDRQARVVHDDRLADLPGGRPYTYQLVSSCRNQPGGFWVASTNPAAAYQAISGSAELDHRTEVGLFTDGATRLVDYYQYSWDGFFGLLRKSGPAGLIATVRANERELEPPAGKQHDDATVIHMTASR